MTSRMASRSNDCVRACQKVTSRSSSRARSWASSAWLVAVAARALQEDEERQGGDTQAGQEPEAVGALELPRGLHELGGLPGERDGNRGDQADDEDDLVTLDSHADTARDNSASQEGLSVRAG